MALAQQPQPPQVQALLAAEQGPSSSSDPEPAVLPMLNSGLLAGLTSLEFAFCISDAQHPDMPILFASDGFYRATGYSPAEVLYARVLPPLRGNSHTHSPSGAAAAILTLTLCTSLPVQVIGRNCRFLQGPETERQKVGGVHEGGSPPAPALPQHANLKHSRSGRPAC